jgi:hypothetical protein
MDYNTSASTAGAASSTQHAWRCGRARAFTKRILTTRTAHYKSFTVSGTGYNDNAVVGVAAGGRGPRRQRQLRLQHRHPEAVARGVPAAEAADGACLRLDEGIRSLFSLICCSHGYSIIMRRDNDRRPPSKPTAAAQPWASAAGRWSAAAAPRRGRQAAVATAAQAVACA